MLSAKMTSQELVDDIERLWMESRKDTTYQMRLGRYILFYNPYDDEDLKRVYRIAGAYYEGFLKGGRVFAEECLIKEMSKEKQ